MLAIRMQRTGRKGHPQFRVIVQEARLSPASGRVVKALGSYNPHTKTAVIDKDATVTFLKNGAQPSPRIVKLLTSEGIKMPAWVEKADTKKKKAIKNTDKLRRNRPAEEVIEEPKAEEAIDATPEAEPTEAVAEEQVATVEDATAEDKPAE